MGPSLGRLGDTYFNLPLKDLVCFAAMGPSLGRLGDLRPDANGCDCMRRNGAEPRKARRLLSPKKDGYLTLAAMGPSLGRLGDERPPR